MDLASLVAFGFIAVCAIIFFLIIRELVIWYYKINERIGLMRRNNELLEGILDKLNESVPIKTDGRDDFSKSGLDNNYLKDK